MRVPFFSGLPASQAIFMMANTVCAAAFFTFAEAASTRQIEVLSATFSGRCIAKSNVTADLRRQCDGRLICPYVVRSPTSDVQRASCRVDLIAQWRCSANETHIATVRHVLDSTGTLMISCVSQTGPGH
jgi:hypothetical protein